MNELHCKECGDHPVIDCRAEATMTEGELAKLLAERATDLSAWLKPPWYELRARAYWRKNCQPRQLVKQLETELIGEMTGRILYGIKP